MIYLLLLYHSNVAKRAIKTPKLYFLDIGLIAFLTKWGTAEQIEIRAMAGAFFETFVFCLFGIYESKSSISIQRTNLNYSGR